ncbi:MAG: PorV/PorQ family protein [candidate division FCPU426 bacterium]
MTLQPASGAGTSGGILLRQAVGARALGMGEAFAGVADDATALFWNPGGLSQVTGLQANATYQAGLAESAYEQILASYCLNNLGTISLGLSLLQGGMVDLDNPDGTLKQVQSQSDVAFSAGFGANLTPALGLGLAVKMLNSTLAEEVSAMAVAADLGALLTINEQLTVGVVLQNAGTEIKYQEEGDPLPLTARLGAGYQVDLAEDHAGLLAVDLVKANDQDFSLNLGAEYWYAGFLALRLGYKTGSDLEGLTAGFGAHYQFLQFDYAFGLAQELSNTHKVSLSLIL